MSPQCRATFHDMCRDPNCDCPHHTSLAAAREARDEAVHRVEDHSDPDWRERALDAVQTIALRQPYLIANDLWELIERPVEPRATGPVMTRARSLGIISPTDQFRPIPSVSRHAAPVRVWRSLVYQVGGS